MAKKVNIAYYISSLLYDYSSVVVPGFGAFITQYIPSKVDTETGMVSPPVKTIQFNEKLNLNDGLLISHIARHERINDSEAENYISNFVNNINDQLNYGQPVFIEGLGTFNKLPQSDIVNFTPAPDINFSTETFGLSSVELPTIETEEGTVPSEIPPPPLGTEFNFHANDEINEDEDGNETSIYPSNDAPNSEKRSLHEVLAAGSGGNMVTTTTSANEEPIEPSPKKPNYWWWLIPVVLLVVFIVVLTQMPTGKKDETDLAVADSISELQTDTKDLVSSENDLGSKPERDEAYEDDQFNDEASGNQSNNDISDSGNGESNGSTENNSGNTAATQTTNTSTSTSSARGGAAEEPKTPPAATTGTANNNRGNATADTQNPPSGYYVVIASLDSKAKAQKMSSKLSKRAENVYFMEAENGKYRIGYHYENLSEAQSAQSDLKNTYTGAWILKR